MCVYCGSKSISYSIVFPPKLKQLSFIINFKKAIWNQVTEKLNVELINVYLDEAGFVNLNIYQFPN